MFSRVFRKRAAAGPARSQDHADGFNWRSPWEGAAGGHMSPAAGSQARAGIEATGLQELWDTHAARLRELLEGLPLPAAARESMAVPALRGLLSLVHSLPAAPGHHCWQGGLAEYALTAAVFTLQSLEGSSPVEFAGPREKYLHADRTRTAAAMAAIARAAGAVTLQVVTDGQARVWNCELSTLLDWLLVGGTGRYYAEWKKGREGTDEPGYGAAALRLSHRFLISGALDAWLSEPAGTPVRQLLDLAVIGSGPLAETVGSACGKAADSGVPDTPPPARPGACCAQARAVLHAMRQCLASGRWSFNRPGSQVFVTEWGTFVAADRIGDDVSAACRENGSVAVPGDGGAIAALLMDEGIAGGPAGEPHCLWRVKFSDSDEELRCFQVLVPEAFTPPGIGPRAFARIEVSGPDREPPPPAAAGSSEKQAAGAGPKAAMEAPPQEPDTHPAAGKDGAETGDDGDFMKNIFGNGARKGIRTRPAGAATEPAAGRQAGGGSPAPGPSSKAGSQAEDGAAGSYRQTARSLESQFLAGAGRWLEVAGPGGRTSTLREEGGGWLVCSSLTLEGLFRRRGIDPAPLAGYFEPGTFEHDQERHVFRYRPRQDTGKGQQE